MRRVIFFFFSPNEQRGGGGGGEGGAARLFLFFSPFQQTTSGTGHRVKYQVVFFGLATNALNVRNNKNNNNLVAMSGGTNAQANSEQHRTCRWPTVHSKNEKLVLSLVVYLAYTLIPVVIELMLFDVPTKTSRTYYY